MPAAENPLLSDLLTLQQDGSGAISAPTNWSEAPLLDIQTELDETIEMMSTRLMGGEGNVSGGSNARNEVVHCTTRNNRWLELSTGEPTHGLLKFVREELRSNLCTAIVSKVYAETGDQEIDRVMAQAERQASELT